jgi:hypothetical protein
MAQVISYETALEMYNEMLNDCTPMIKIGYLEFDPAYALKELDPIAYNVGFSDFCADLESDDIFVGDENYV